MRRVFSVVAAGLTLAACGGRTPPPASTPSSIATSVAPSRTAGVAPLAVFFDATGTTGLDGDDFLSAHFTWSFGDASAGAWSTTGLSRNLATGFLAAHVFETPGTYVVSVDVRDRTGRVGPAATTTLTVVDPEVVHAGPPASPPRRATWSATSRWTSTGGSASCSSNATCSSPTATRPTTPTPRPAST